MNSSVLREVPANTKNESIAASLNAKTYLVYYSGSSIAEINALPNSKAIILTPYIAAVFTSPESDDLIKNIKSINIIESYVPYILTDISPLDSANITPFTQGNLIDLTGTGVVVALIDTGIDYLNKEFIREDDTSRILSIWDQSDNSGTPPPGIDYGSVYNNEEINKAIKSSLSGADPLTIVPERDTIGHGTECAGIIGARGYGEVKGAAPNCDFVVIKLRPSEFFEIIPGESSSSIPIYNGIDICTAIRYASEYRESINKPMIIFLPVSSNYGGHAGNRPIEEIIDYYSFSTNIIFALGTGNQGNSQTHYSGIIQNTNATSEIEIQVGNNQNQLNLSIWVTTPDKISIGLVSPSGQIVNKIPAKLSQEETISFLYEKTTATVKYIFPEITSGNEAITIDFTNMAKGIWKIIVYGEYIVTGQFNAWITQRPLSLPGTLVLNSDNYITLTIPSTSASGITTACYNQNNSSLYPLSGVGFTVDNRYKPEIATGGINVLTTTLNNKTITITGSSAATAVLAGAIALLLQWSIVEKNLPNVSALVIKAILMRGASQTPTSTYPNQFVGYGLLDLQGSFDALRGVYKQVEKLGINRSIIKCDDNIEVFIPHELYTRIIASYYNKIGVE